MKQQKSKRLAAVHEKGVHAKKVTVRQSKLQTYRHMLLESHVLTCLTPLCAVPCLRRAADMEAGALQSEYTLGGEEDGWVATHRDPALAGAGV
eukprot:scaffold204460_cov17-Tisochrysis_lutea.AAC.1